MSNPNPGGSAISGPTPAPSPAPSSSPPTVNMPTVAAPIGGHPPVALNTTQYQVVAVAVTYYVTPPSLRVTLWPVNRRVPFCLEDCATIFVDPVTAPAWAIGRIVTLSWA